MFVGVLVVFGGLVAWDITSNNRLGNLGGDNKTNWNWNDNWSSTETPSNPQQPQQPHVTPPQPEKPKDDMSMPQIVATDYQDALAKSGEHGMPVLVLFKADWCGWCKKMESETLTDAKVKVAMKHYIMVYVDTDKDRRTASKFSVRGLPSYVITNNKEANLKSGSGYKDADDFAQWLDNPNLYEQPKAPQDRREQPKEESPRWPRRERS